MSTVAISQDLLCAISPPRTGSPSAPEAAGFLRLMAAPETDEAGPKQAQTVKKQGKKPGEDRKDIAGPTALLPLPSAPPGVVQTVVGRTDLPREANANNGLGPPNRLESGGFEIRSAHGPAGTSVVRTPAGEKPAVGAEPQRGLPEGGGQRIAHAPPRSDEMERIGLAPEHAPHKPEGKALSHDVKEGEAGHVAASASVTVVLPRDQTAATGQPGAAQAVQAAFFRDRPMPGNALPASQREPEEAHPLNSSAGRKPSLATVTANINAEQPVSNLSAMSRKGRESEDAAAAVSLPGVTASAPNSATSVQATPSAHSAIPAQLAGQAAGQMAASAQAHGVQGTAELLLNPEELGKVRMTFRHHDGIVAVSISAERPDTLQLLRSHVGLLAQEFTASGFAGSRFSFQEEPRSDRQASDGAGGGGTEPAGTAMARPPPTARGQSMIAGATLDLRM